MRKIICYALILVGLLPMHVLAAKQHVIIVKKNIIKKTVNILGTIKSAQTAMLAAPNAGILKTLYFKDGQYVKKGQKIAELNNDQYIASVNQAKANLNLAKVTYNRMKIIYKKGYLNKQSLDNVRTKVQVALAMLESAQAKLNDSIIIAPFSGQLGMRLIDVGNYVEKGTPVVSLVDKHLFKVVYHLPERYWNEVKIGQKIFIRTNNGLQFQGKVVFVSPKMHKKSRSMTLEVVLNDVNSMLKPGMLVQVEHILNPKYGAIELPLDVVATDVDGSYVYLLINGKSVKTEIVLGEQRKNYVIIVSGLKDGDKVITNHQFDLAD